MTTYTDGKEIGRGSFGLVRRVTDENGNLFAKKTFVDPNIAGLPKDDLIRRFDREVRLQSSIDHPNVIRILDSKLADDPPWFVMELADRSLKDMMEAGDLDNAAKRQALFDILSGLEAIHDLGYKHRDLKPGNVLFITRSAGACFAISDFGLGAPRDGETSTLTATGVQGGTEMYAAPELAKSFRRATIASDIYSFGAILHDFYVGKRRTPYAKQYGSGPIGAIIEKCTETVPRKRYQDIASLRSDLYAALEDLKDEKLSSEDQKVVEILDKDHISDEEWDVVFIRIDEIESDRDFSRKIILSFSGEQIAELSENHPELLSAYAHHLLEYVIETEGGLPFEFCDVLADQIMLPYQFADIEAQAYLALAMLILGTRHNRWYVERKFLGLAGPESDGTMIQRLISEADARRLKLGRYIGHLPRSITMSGDDLNEKLRAFLPDE